MAFTVTRQDPRYEALCKGRNARWPVNDADGAGRIVYCIDASDLAEALQKIVSAGMRPTVRSGGHCYEDFVASNPNGAILDVSVMNGAGSPGAGQPYKIGPGTMLGNVYLELYKLYGVTLPGGSCVTVGAGGHICGGGYGVLSRLQGLTSDWLTGVEIATVDAQGKVALRKVDAQHDPDLFRACRGGGGGNFGIITSYEFAKLPPAPEEVIEANFSFPWAGMTEERLVKILMTYGSYWETRGKDPDTWGMFTGISLTHQSNGRFGMGVQFCNPDGTCRDLTVLNEFMDRFGDCGVAAAPGPGAGREGFAARQDLGQTSECIGNHTVRRRSWLEATVGGGGGSSGLVGDGERSKYKSAYMKRGFTEAEARILYKHLTRTIPGTNLKGSVINVDSYGGATNRLELADTTSVAQRSSVMKLQHMTFWADAKQDEGHLKWLSDMYTELYSTPDADPRHLGTPYWNDHYEGCYINYPDKDMLAYDYWPELYYGNKGLYPFLQGVKRKYDPNNVFHHAMSIRP